MLNARKLVAIDPVFLGSKTIIAEFSAGVFLSAALGVFVPVRERSSVAQIVLGLYLISLSVNYIPMLIYAIAITRARSARGELGPELDNKRVTIAEYRRQSLWLLVPLVVPLTVFSRAWTDRS